jgi:predicted transcriptional regulator
MVTRMQVNAIISRIARPVCTIAGHQSVEEAVNLMTAKKVSALVVTESDNPIGMFAERDVFRMYVKDRPVDIRSIPVKDAMTPNLIAAKPEDDIDAMVALMIKSDIKHVPVMGKDGLMGMLTLNDLIEHQIENLAAEIRHLREYIADLHDAGQD